MTTAKPTRQEIAKAHPEAVRVAREFRAVFGDDVRLIYAHNRETGATLGRPSTKAQK